MPEIKYTLYRTRRKNLLLKLKNDGTLALYCPKSYPKKKALEFLYANADKMARLAKERDSKRLITIFGDLSAPSLLYLGERYPVLYRQTKKLSFDGETFYAPFGIAPDALHSLYKDFLRAEAKRLLPALARELAAKTVALNNSSLQGTVRYALEQNDLREIVDMIKYIDLSANPYFSDLFINNMMFE